MEGMDNIQDQIRELQTSVRRQRLAIVALASVLTGIALIGAVRPVGDATFDTITCKEWKVVDKDGKVRIGAGSTSNTAGMAWNDKDERMRVAIATSFDGAAVASWYDKDGKGRLTAATLPDGKAVVSWLDRDEKVRISASTTLDGPAGTAWFDKDGNLRIDLGTDPEGQAGAAWLDRDRRPRIAAGTSPDGKVILPTEDIK
jgi:YD repeat-containing protein